MSFVRRQILPLFGAGMTLAVGIALGAGPLQGENDDASADAGGATAAELSDQMDALAAAQAFDDATVAGISSGLLDGRLAGRTVTLVVLPGVTEERAEAVRTAVKAAGGTTAVTVMLDEDLLDPGKKTYVSSVAASSLKGADDVAKNAGDEPYEQMGALIARAYSGHAGAITIDDEATRIDSELQGAKLVTVAGEPHERGSLTIVLGTAAHGDDVETDALQLISTSLLRGIAAGDDGTAVATPKAGADEGGLIDAIEADDRFAKLRISTLNVADGAAATVALVYALAAAADDRAGSYGVDGSEVVLPPGMAAAHGGS